MDIQTTRFGRISLDEDRIIHMKRGLIGFADKQRYAVISPRPSSALHWYQSIDDPALAFVITSPRLFVPQYRIHFGEGVLEALGTSNPDELDIYVLVTIPPGRPEEMTANLIGPLVVNSRARLAEQLIVDDSSYSHKHPLHFKGGIKKGQT